MEGSLGFTGFELSIDDDFIKKLETADKKIQQLADTTDTAKKRIIDAFKSMGDDGVEAFLKKLREAETALDKLGNKNIKVNLDMSTSGRSDISSKIDDMTRLAQGYDNLAQSQKNSEYAAEEAAKQASNAHQRRMAELSAEAQRILLNATEQKALKQEQQNVATQQLNEQKEAKRQLSLQDKQATQDARVAAARIKTEGDELIAQEKEKQIEIKRTTAEIQRMAKAYRAATTVLSEDNINELMGQSRSAVTINQRIVAINNLKNALRDIDTTSANYKETQKELTVEIGRQKRELAALGVDIDSTNQKKRNLGNTADQLARKLALVFSVSAITGYMKKMVQVRAEFELQQRSLAVILKSKGEANRIWEQTLDLAVKSPFTIQELHGYVKELSAYRIETEALFDTTKRLADVSAGLGVDMSRLILAYGQVRAAEYLRGTELRQFTEAGIPLLQELADRFTALEGRAVSTADVFSRISKRMVTFQDVAAVFRSMTDEGGTFYRMQEEQSQTLAGQLSNLKDEISIMLNDIGKETQGIIVMFIQLAKTLIRNWRAIAPVLQLVIGLTLTYKVALMTMSGAARQAAIGLGYVKAGTIGLTGAIKKLFWVLKSNPYGAIIGGILTVATTLFSVFKSGSSDVKELDEQLEETKRSVAKIKFKFDNASDINTYREQLLALYNVAKQQYGIKLDINWGAKSPDELKAEFEKAYAEIQDYSKTFNRAVTLFGGNKEDRAQLSQDVTNYVEQTKANIEQTFHTLIEDSKQFNSQFKDETKKTIGEIDDILKRVIDNDDEWLKQFPRLLYKIQELRQNLFNEANDLAGGDGRNALRQWSNTTRAALNETFGYGSLLVDRYFERVNAMWEQYEAGLDVIIKRAQKFPTIEQRTDFIMKYVDGLSVYDSWDDFERAAILRRISGRVDIQLNLIPQRPQPDKLQGWQDEYNKLFAENRASPASNLAKLSNAQETQSDVIKKLNSELSDYKKRLEEVSRGSDAAYGGAEKRAKEMATLRVLIANTTRAIQWLGGAITNTSKSAESTKDWYTELANALKNAHKEFQTLNKDLSASASKALMLERHTEVLNDIISNLKLGGKFNWKTFDLTTEEGIIQALEKLKNITPSVNKTALLNIKKALSDIRGEVQIDIAKDSLDKAKKQMDNLFTNYKLFVELDDMGVPRDWASEMFGLDATSLDEVKQRLEELRMFGRFDSENGQKQYKDYLQKIAEMEDEERLASMKKYIEYLLKSTSARVKAQLDGQKKINEINKTFRMTDEQATKNLGIGEYAWDAIKSKVDDLTTSIQNMTEAEVLFFKAAGLSDEQISKLSEYIQLMNNAKQRAIIGVQRETQTAVDKASWDDFKNTDLYIEMFENLDMVATSTLERMRDKLQEMRDSLKGLDPSELKEIVKKFNDVESALVSKNPFEYVVKNVKDAFTAVKKYKAAEKEALSAQEKVDSQKKAVDDLQLQVAQQHKIVAEKNQSSEISAEEQAREVQKLHDLEMQLAIAQKLLSVERKNAENAEKDKNAKKQTLANMQLALQESASRLNEGYSAFTGLTDEIQNTFGSFDDGMKDFLENIGAVIGGVTTLETGISEILSGKVITGSIHAVTGVVKTIGGLFGFGTKDKRKERQIQREISMVNDLQRAYEKLEKAIDNAYSINTAQDASQKARANLQAQIQSYQSMISAEKDKKNTDNERIKEWQNNIEDLQEQIKELEEQAFEKATDGIISNVLDASKEFTDAWLQAFEETGNGISGLEENFTEAMKTMLKQQASMIITSKWVEKWKKDLEKYVNMDDMELTVSEAKRWADSVRESLPGLSNALENYFNAFKQAGIEFSDKQTMSGLQAGIQGITEEQADILAAYWNSVRFYVANIDTTLSQLANHVMGGTNSENPQLAQLKIIAQQTTAINNLLSSLTAKHPTLAGYGLKVVI